MQSRILHRSSSSSSSIASSRRPRQWLARTTPSSPGPQGRRTASPSGGSPLATLRASGCPGVFIHSNSDFSWTFVDQQSKASFLCALRHGVYNYIFRIPILSNTTPSRIVSRVVYTRSGFVLIQNHHIFPLSGSNWLRISPSLVLFYTFRLNTSLSCIVLHLWID